MEVGRSSTSFLSSNPMPMESLRWSSAITMEVGRSSTWFPCAWRVQDGSLPSSWRSVARRFFFNKVHRGAQSYFPWSWRTQEGALSLSWRSAARRFFLKKCAKERTLTSHDHGEPKGDLCHHHRDRRIVDSSIPMPMERPRWSSAIIIEFRRRTHLI